MPCSCRPVSKTGLAFAAIAAAFLAADLDGVALTFAVLAVVFLLRGPDAGDASCGPELADADDAI